MFITGLIWIRPEPGLGFGLVVLDVLLFEPLPELDDEEDWRFLPPVGGLWVAEDDEDVEEVP